MDDFTTWLSAVTEPETVDVVESSAGYKNDLFKDVLPALERRDIKFFSRLTPEQQDEIEPWQLMRWCVSVPNSLQKSYLMNVNESLNIDFGYLAEKKSIGKKGHKELMWMLLAICGEGRGYVNRKYIKPSRRAMKNVLEIAVLDIFPNYNDDELELFFKINTKAQLIELFKDNGHTDAEIKILFKGYDKD